MTNELVVQHNDYSIMPVMDILQAKQRRQAVIDFVAGLMVEGIHYGKVPGTSKNTLMKPGGEMLVTFFGLAPRFIGETIVEDWTGENHGGEPFFYYRYRCELRRGDFVAGDGIGSCNSWEGKYRYRSASRRCPNCGSETIIKGKAEYGGGWLCFAKKGGCGAKFADGDQAIEGQETGKVKNDNPQDIVNTIDKMAQKRALVAATLIAVNASEFFTQDVEDMDFGVIEGSFTETAPEKKAPPPQRTEVQRQPIAKPAVAKTKPAAAPVVVDSDTPPASLADFAVWFAARHAYYNDNYHVVGALKKIYGGSIGTQFLSYDKAEVMAKLDAYANDEANGAD